MSCKNCRHWFVNPNIVIPGEPSEGKCLVSEIKTQSNHVCNAWELSVSFDQAQKSNSVPKNVTEFKELINKLIEAAEPFITFRKIQTNNRPDVWDVQLLEKHLANWDELVSIVKANKREEAQE